MVSLLESLYIMYDKNKVMFIIFREDSKVTDILSIMKLLSFVILLLSTPFCSVKLIFHEYQF